MTTHCPDCLAETPVRKAGKDGRCAWCRSRVGRRARVHQRYIPDPDELAARPFERTTP